MEAEPERARARVRMSMSILPWRFCPLPPGWSLPVPHTDLGPPLSRSSSFASPVLSSFCSSSGFAYFASRTRRKLRTDNAGPRRGGRVNGRLGDWHDDLSPLHMLAFDSERCPTQSHYMCVFLTLLNCVFWNCPRSVASSSPQRVGDLHQHKKKRIHYARCVLQRELLLSARSKVDPWPICRTSLQHDGLLMPTDVAKRKLSADGILFEVSHFFLYRAQGATFHHRLPRRRGAARA